MQGVVFLMLKAAENGRLISAGLFLLTYLRSLKGTSVGTMSV